VSPWRAAIAACLALLAAGCQPSEAGDESGARQVVEVRCEPARTGTIAERVELRGVVGVPPGREAVLAPAAAGRLVEVRVKDGDRVHRNDVLAVVDDPALGAAVNEGDAAEGAARAAQGSAASSLAREERLVGEGIAPRRNLEEARSKLAQAEADVRAASARRLLAAQQRLRAKLVAPIDGEVTKVMGRIGDLVDGTPATPVVVIDDLETLELHIDTPAADLVKLREKAPAELRLDALPGVAFRGEVAAISPAVDPATALGTTRVAFDASNADLARVRIGLAGGATIMLGERPGVTVVPATAVRRSLEGAHEVVVCSPDATAAVRDVTTGARDRDVVEISAGVAPGDLVVVDHVIGLEDGTPIRVVRTGGAGGAR
jgi:RND family efflux transporter MFP subunit